MNELSTLKQDVADLECELNNLVNKSFGF